MTQTPAGAPLRLAIIIGSNRQGRFAPTVANWFVEHVRQRDELDVDVIDLAGFDIPSRLGKVGGAAMTPFRERVGRADAFVIVTPEYNHGYPAALKQAIDFVHAEWQAKPIGFVAYGGVSGGLRAVEQLRLVFAELHAVTIRDSVSLHGASQLFDEHGALRNPDPANAAAKLMLDELLWFAQALRAARESRPYSTLRPAG